jgi:hypothetical protein
MRPRTILSSLSITVVGLAGLGLSGAASNPPACPSLEGAPPADGTSPPAEGAPAAAIHGEGLVVVDPAGRARPFRHVDGSAGLLRHATSRPGSGTVYVDDLRGADQLVVLGEGGVERVTAAGEATHPTLGPGGALAWAEDLERLRLRPRPGAAVRTFEAPRGARAVFSPVFVRGEALLAVVEEAVDTVTHDTGLDNLFRLDRGTGRWSRVTRFRAGSDRWSAIRTPVVGRDGTVWFVRVTGKASATRRPSFELWRLGKDDTARVRALPTDRFLSGAVAGRLLWNVFDPGSGGWRLVLDGPEGSRLVGCGATMTDPTGPDPDLDPARSAAGPSGQGETSEQVEEGFLGIVVGDFGTREEASAVAERIGAEALVSGHGGSPAAVGPDRFVAAVPLPSDADPEVELDELRRRFPEYVESSWIAVLGKPGEEEAE